MVIDTAHGHSKGVLDRVRWIKKHYPQMQVMAGNIATEEAALALVEAGVDAVKVGIGPGSICTTRIISGVGVPQLTAVANVAKALKQKGIPLVADGGIRYSGDVCKAIDAGAQAIMVWKLIRRYRRGAWEVELYQAEPINRIAGWVL